MVFPLFLLFFLTNHQMRTMEERGREHLVEIGVKHANDSIEQYLKIRECDILEKLQDIPVQQQNEYTLKKVFAGSSLRFIYGKNVDKVDSGYVAQVNSKNGKNDIYTFFVIPINSSNLKGIKILENVNYNQITIKGPFRVEFYSGNKIAPETLITVLRDPLMHGMPPREGVMPPPPEMGKDVMMPPLPRENGVFGPPPPHEFEKIENGIPKNSFEGYAVVPVKDPNGNVIASILIKVIDHRRGAPEPVKNLFNLIILLTGSAFSFIIAAFIDKNFIKPLVSISSAAKEVAKGNLAIEISTDIKQEQILNTFNSFNKMVKGLREKEDLRRSFIASLTHDLRTPLIAQERTVALLSEKFKQLGLEEEYSLSKSIESNSVHLLRMVNLILDSYQFDLIDYKPTYSNFSLKRLADECFGKVSQLAVEKNIEFKNQISDELNDIESDRTGLTRVFVNLISNAIENISNNCEIKIHAEIKEKFIIIVVEDNGPGIAPEEQEHIFDRYYTGKGFDRKIGSGLGLDVCNKIIQALNGNIKVISEVEKYTKFIITLPL